MAGEFGDLVGMDFDIGGGGDFNVPDVPEPGGGIPTPPSGGGGFDFGDIAKGAKDIAGDIGAGVKGVLGPVGDLAKSVSPIASLATAGMGIAGGIQASKTAAQQAKVARDSQRLQQQNAAATAAAAQPLTDFGKEQLKQAQAGQIPPAIQAQIDTWAQGAKAQARDYMARSGQGNSQAMTQWEAYIDQQAKAMAATYLQQEQSLGMQGLTQGANALGSSGAQAGRVAEGAGQQQGGIDALMKQTNEMLAKLSAGAA